MEQDLGGNARAINDIKEVSTTARKRRAMCNQGIIFFQIRPNLYS